MYQLGAKQFTLNPINHQNKETASRKASHRKNLRYSKYMYLKHWKTFETTLTAESKYLLVKAGPRDPDLGIVVPGTGDPLKV